MLLVSYSKEPKTKFQFLPLVVTDLGSWPEDRCFGYMFGNIGGFNTESINKDKIKLLGI